MIEQVRDGILFYDGCNTLELAREFGTPLYVYSETDILEKINEMKECFTHKYDRTRIAYAAKAFGVMGIFKLMEREGLCIDVVSGGELYTAIKAGFPPERIEFNGNNKQIHELEMAIDYGIGRIIVDGIEELSLIEEICRDKGKRIEILYRITPGVRSDSHDYIVTGKKDSQFGMPLDEYILMPAVEAAIKSEAVDFKGYHFHLGSQLFDNASHLQAVEILLDLIERTRDRFNFEIEEVNLGGGFGIRYTTEIRKPFSYFLEPMMERIEEYFKEKGRKRPEVVIEPGRSLVGESGMTLYTVGNIKEIEGIRKYVAVNGGMPDNIRPALYQAKYRGTIANKASLGADDKVTVCGKCCESGDVLMRDVALQRAERGDVLAVFTTGAYGYSMASNYNKNPIPAVVLVKDGRAEIMVKRQSYEDMIMNELIPDSMK